ncbi:selenium-dependent xanthine dehydrogenase [Sarcina sp. DSM 11001]|uniref:selenium-dependent xanthine dehydrogenase n=1 Tax=Sarcina sp. DSM 11001 TaxID=1798184 RepID=UPI0008907A8A|nr:selenium-dependent xanthine dehydrogenase [Sarcina sp. DSM 11001]SDL47807.1 selenium-dependent xanthine dehydrogenase [Sarcina sp. DSM 11001]
MQEKYQFTVNGRQCSTDENKPLLRFLRDDLHLYSVKDGCSEGACGTCTIVVDGAAVKSCVLTTQKAAGRNILTVEGLSDFEKEAFVYAFGISGSVQCGFCTPGMVMAGKALLDKNPDPSEEEIRTAIRGNICRCTGYRKIIDGIRLTASILRGETKIDPEAEKGDDFGVGRRAFRIDVRKKVLGYGKYPDDIEMEGMLHLSAVRSKYARARVLSIDASAALVLPGVAGVLTAEDVPNNKVGHLQQDWDVMIAVGSVTRCVGDAICLVAAETEEILEKAKKLVKVEYEVLEPVTTIARAMAPDAPKVHSAGNLCQSRHVTRGDAAAALAASAYTVTRSFSTPFTEHAFLEPECAVAFPYKDGVKILSTDQGVYDTRKEVSIMFGWDPERVVVENQLVGGGFGGKEDVTVQHISALAAWIYKRPVKARFSRQESINFHPKRHAMEGTFTLGCDENGIFTALDCDIYFDTGAYASLCGPVLERACTHSVGPYCYQNTDIRGYGYYTNNPPAGAFRGFGVCQSEFALESMINLLAEKVGISPWEIRFRNAIEPGKVLPNGQIADPSTALKETLLAVKDVYEANPGRAGIACAMKNSGVGVGLPDKGRARLVIEDGVCVIYCAASDIGQGCLTVFCQDVAQATGLPLSRIRNGAGSTEIAPDSGTTSGSRQTLLSGEAVRQAALQLAQALEEAGGDLSALEGREFFYEYFEPTDKLGADVPFPKSHIAYGYATHVVILDEKGRVTEVYAAHDSGKVVNPISIQGQIEGGVLMGMGYALTEDFPLRDGAPQARYGTLGLLRAPQIPDIHAIYVEKEELLPVAYGAKGIGEIAAIPTAPALQGAYYALDGIFRTKLPMEKTWYKK